MTFTLPDPTALVVVFFVFAAVAVGYAAVALGTALLEHRAVRVRRHEGVRQYYGNVVAGN